MPATSPEQIHHQTAHQAAPTYAAPATLSALWLFPVAFLGACVLTAAIVARFQKRKPGTTARNYTAAESLLTKTELRFWQTLRTVTGQRAHVLMKVRQSDILIADRGDVAARNGVSQKHVDFLLCHPETLKPLVAVELDDRSHDRADRKARDVFVDEAFASAGLPILHVPVAGRYEARELEAILGRHLPVGPAQALTNRPGL